MTSPNTVSPPRSLTTMQPFFRELSVNRETAITLLEGLTNEQLGWRPAPDRWGLADICSHLAIMMNCYLPSIDESIRHGHADAAYSDRPFHGSVVSRLLVWSMEPPVRVRLRTPKGMQPRHVIDAEQALQLYHTSQNAFELRLERAAGLDLAHVRVRHPLFSPARLALGSVLAILLAHERRHLGQATAVRNDAAFPLRS